MHGPRFPWHAAAGGGCPLARHGRVLTEAQERNQVETRRWEAVIDASHLQVE